MSGHRWRETVVGASRFLLSYRGRLDRLPYAVAAWPVVGLTDLIWLGWFTGFAASLPAWSHVLPGPVALLVGVLLRFWILPAISLRRAADAGIGGWVGFATIVPVVDLLIVLGLCVLPQAIERPRDPDPSADDARMTRRLVLGASIGVVMVVAAVAVGALLIGRYGTGLFLYAPFMIGVTAAYVANMAGDIGRTRTMQLLLVVALLGAVALLVVALEGLVCIVLLLPVAVPLMLAGGEFGRALAMRVHRSYVNAAAAPALLVALLALEQFAPVGGGFQRTQTIRVEAPAGVVWDALIRMQPIEQPPALPFRLGISYPVAGHVVDGREGAIRYGRFSTGVAVERITVWRPDAELAFEVLSEPASMRELSFYRTVHAPHVRGYFSTLRGSFRLSRLEDGSTLLWERTEHRLELAPLAYWLPLARWMVDRNNERVLTHVKAQAENAART